MSTDGIDRLKTTEFSEYNRSCTVEFGGQPELHPHVRFAEDDDGTKQYGTLHSAYDPIPDDAVYCSEVYLLTERERGRLDGFETGWYGNGQSIATDLQDRCEAGNRVLYPVHIEADKGDLWKDAEGGQIRWIREFIEEHLPVSVHDCRWYFSGSRSIHCHVPLFTTGDGIDHLRAACKDFYGGLDPSVYGRKGQFRLPAVRHDKTGYPKVEIEPEWEDERIGQEAVTTNPERPETYADFLRDVFGPDVLDRPEQFLWNPCEPDEPASEPHIWEPGTDRPFGQAEDKWEAYNRHAFSPYALSGNGLRSMAVVRPIGGAFGRDGDTFLPCRIQIAKGCNGDLWHYDGECPVKLSKPDCEKIAEMDVEPGDDLLIIGGKSGQSRIFRLTTWEEVDVIWGAILDENAMDGTRSDTLQVIREFGFEPGNPGMNGEYREKSGEREPSKAATLQAQAERRGIDALSHPEQVKVANRLLRVRGFGRTVEWFKEQFGDDFDRKRTIKILKSICRKYDDLPDVV